MSVALGMMGRWQPGWAGSQRISAEVVRMRNQFDATCAMCGATLGGGDGIVHTHAWRRPYPVFCDDYMSEVDQMDRDARESERDFD